MTRFAWVVIGSALVGCGHADAPHVAPVAGGARPVDAGLAAEGDAGAPTTTPVMVDAGGQSRLVLVHAPAGVGGGARDPDRARPRPARLGRHRRPVKRRTAPWIAVAEAHGFVVAYPQGAIPLGGGFAWNVPGQPLLGGQAVPDGSADDVDFIARAVAAIELAYPIDPKRVYATGMSGGARMASQLGCDLATVLAAVAPVAGLRIPAPCSGPRAVSVVAFHGTADTTNPYDGNGQAYWTYSVPVAEQGWATHDGCDPTPATSQAAPSVTLTTYGGLLGRRARCSSTRSTAPATSGRARPGRRPRSTWARSCGPSSRPIRSRDRRA